VHLLTCPAGWHPPPCPKVAPQHPSICTHAPFSSLNSGPCLLLPTQWEWHSHPPLQRRQRKAEPGSRNKQGVTPFGCQHLCGGHAPRGQEGGRAAVAAVRGAGQCDSGAGRAPGGTVRQCLPGRRGQRCVCVLGPWVGGGSLHVLCVHHPETPTLAVHWIGRLVPWAALPALQQGRVPL
jgi:hypothetical protein